VLSLIGYFYQLRKSDRFQQRGRTALKISGHVHDETCRDTAGSKQTCILCFGTFLQTTSRCSCGCSRGTCSGDGLHKNLSVCLDRSGCLFLAAAFAGCVTNMYRCDDGSRTLRTLTTSGLQNIACRKYVWKQTAVPFLWASYL
jgi:hypothetical protein